MKKDKAYKLAKEWYESDAFETSEEDIESLAQLFREYRKGASQ
jgi:hypothetical protein